MLNITFKDKAKPSMDIDMEFKEIVGSISGSDTNKRLIQKIDKGTYIDEDSFMDRFGYKLRMSDLSTGCKAALLVANTSIMVDLQECGENAKSIIFNNCKSGNVMLWIDWPEIVTRQGKPEDEADIQCDGYRFRTISRYNYYMRNEEGVFEPDLSVPGVEILDKED
jgi:hypothetical protein